MSIIEDIFKDSVPFLESKGFDKLIFAALIIVGFTMPGDHSKEIIPFALGGLSTLTNATLPSRLFKTKGQDE